MEKVPHGKFRDKGTPIDNLCNYDSASETFLAIRDLEVVKTQKLIFVTKNGYIKMVEGTEFDVSKLTVAGTKLEEGDRLLSVHEAHFASYLVFVTKNSMALRISQEDIPLQKKNASRMAVVSICVDASPSQARLFLRSDSISWPNVCDGKMWESPLLTQLGVSTVCSNIITDKRGFIVARNLDSSKLSEKLESLLK